MLGRHLGRALTEQQRGRWVRLMGEAAYEAGLPADPEFRSAFVFYLEWGHDLLWPTASQEHSHAAPAGSSLGMGTAGPPSASPGAAPLPAAPANSPPRAGTRIAAARLADFRVGHPTAVHRPGPDLDGLGRPWSTRRYSRSEARLTVEMC